MNEPGDNRALPSAPLTIAEAPEPILGDGAPWDASEITLNPERVRAYAVPFEWTAKSRGGTFERVAPKTVTGGFSAMAPTTDVELLRRSANSSRGRESPTAVVEVIFCLACVVSRRNRFGSIAATAATLRLVANGAGSVDEGSSEPPISARAEFNTSPFAR